MNSKSQHWNKKELQIYILLLCANADHDESKEELRIIKSKSDASTFERIYKEFKQDSEEERIEKIDDAVQLLEYSISELNDLRREMYEVFFADCNFSVMERNLDKILDNILY
jgi:hypothetical protein